MDVTPIKPQRVDIAARAARIAAARALTLSRVDASGLVGLEVGGLGNVTGEQHRGVVAFVDPDNRGSAYVLATLSDGVVIRVPKTVVSA